MASEAAGASRQGSSRSASGQSETAQNTEELQVQIETLKEDLAAISKTLTDLVRSGVREGKSKVERKAAEYRKQGMDQADAAMEEAIAYGEALEGKIVQNPFAAVLVALGLGFLVGLMSRR
jgi:ElaB/YqjD/DUF883 family membrane-anchored ribosome-binding protein